MPTVVDTKLYTKAKLKYKHMPHSAYKSGLVVQEYKRLGGRYVGKKWQKKGLSRWFKEEWRNQDGQVGYRKKSDVYRPTKRVTKKTPTTHRELTKKQLARARKEKATTGRVKRFVQKKKAPHSAKRKRGLTQTKSTKMQKKKKRR